MPSALSKRVEGKAIPLVAPLDGLTRRDFPWAGAKAANLGEAMHAGLPVPGGFCLTTAAYRLWVESAESVPGLLVRLDEAAPRYAEPDNRREPSDAAGQGAPCEVAAELRALLATVPVPESVEAAVRATLDQFPSVSAWAVRSSAVAEDSPGASFAGQHDTLLNVSGPEAVLAAVRQCWISLFTDRAVSYRRSHQIPQSDAAMAVVMQAMVLPDCAGVLFTADPVTGDDDRIVIEAVKGLAEALVAGKVSPERLTLEKSSRRILTRTGSKPAVATRRDPTRGARRDPRAEPALAGPCLGVAQAELLCGMAIETERLFGAAQDLEWAIRGEQVFLLQARPITNLRAAPLNRGSRTTQGSPGDPPLGTREAGGSLPAAAAASSASVPPGQRPAPPGSDASCGLNAPEIWTHANIGEALPDVVTPMAWSLMQILLHQFLCPLLRRLGIPVEPPPFAKLIAGRAYLNVGIVHSLAGGINWFPVDIARTFGGHFAAQANPAFSQPRPRFARFGLSNLAHAFRLVVWLLPGLFRRQRVLERWGEGVFSELPRTPLPSLADADLARLPRAVFESASRGAGERTWAAAIWMAIAGIGGATAVFQVTRRWLDDADGRIANRLIAGGGGMNSAENGLALLRLAAWARPFPGLTAGLLDPVPFETLEARLPAIPGGQEFLERWRQFMERHGHQARGGMDVAQPRWSETPDLVLDMLRAYLRFDPDHDPLALHERRQYERPVLLAECRRRLRNPLKRWLLFGLVRAAQRGLMQRENVKDAGVRVVARLRQALREAGRRLAERGVLSTPDDVFFLTLEELETVLIDSPGPSVAATIATRQAEHARYQREAPLTEIVGADDFGSATAGLLVPDARVLRGVGVSPGVVTGPARVILQADAAERVLPGEVLVAPYTDPGWTPYFLAAAAIVVDVGGLLSHGSVVAREYGLPAVVNVGAATRVIRSGQLLRVDGNRGVVTILNEPGV